MIRKILAFTATALPLLAFALTPSSASAQSFTGNYPVSVTQIESGNIKFGNQSYCLELTDDGSAGRPHSGSATLESTDSNPLSGTFQVVGNTIMATFETGSETGEEEFVIFFAPANASSGKIGAGIYDSGGNEVSGLATFGAKNGC